MPHGPPTLQREDPAAHPHIRHTSSTAPLSADGPDPPHTANATAEIAAAAKSAAQQTLQHTIQQQRGLLCTQREHPCDAHEGGKKLTCILCGDDDVTHLAGCQKPATCDHLGTAPHVTCVRKWIAQKHVDGRQDAAVCEVCLKPYQGVVLASSVSWTAPRTPYDVVVDGVRPAAPQTLAALIALTCSFAVLFGVFAARSPEEAADFFVVAALGYLWCFGMCLIFCTGTRATDRALLGEQA